MSKQKTVNVVPVKPINTGIALAVVRGLVDASATQNNLLLEASKPMNAKFIEIGEAIAQVIKDADLPVKDVLTYDGRKMAMARLKKDSDVNPVHAVIYEVRQLFVDTCKGLMKIDGQTRKYSDDSINTEWSQSVMPALFNAVGVKPKKAKQVRGKANGQKTKKPKSKESKSSRPTTISVAGLKAQWKGLTRETKISVIQALIGVEQDNDNPGYTVNDVVSGFNKAIVGYNKIVK